MTVDSVANALKEISQLFNCPYETAWEKYMHPAITGNYTCEEIMKVINLPGEE